MIEIPKTAHGVAKLATPEEIAKEDGVLFLCTDTDLILLSDSGDEFVINRPKFGYTNPNLHRRIETDPIYEPGVDYLLVHRDKDGVPYKQTNVIGVWDGINSYRTIHTQTHDEESTTCEIP